MVLLFKSRGEQILCVHVASSVTERSDMIDTLCAWKSCQIWLLVHNPRLKMRHVLVVQNPSSSISTYKSVPSKPLEFRRAHARKMLITMQRRYPTSPSQNAIQQTHPNTTNPRLSAPTQGP